MYRYLVYILEGDDEKENIYITDFDGGNKTMIIKNFAHDMKSLIFFLKS